MPLKSYGKKIDHDIGIPLQDDYFLDEPEEIIESNEVKKIESKVKLPTKIKSKKEKRTIDADVLIVGALRHRPVLRRHVWFKRAKLHDQTAEKLSSLLVYEII